MTTNQFSGSEKTIDRKVYLNTKLSIQVVAPKLQEHRLYRAMEIIDQCITSTAAKAKL
jgi:amidase